MKEAIWESLVLLALVLNWSLSLLKMDGLSSQQCVNSPRGSQEKLVSFFWKAAYPGLSQQPPGERRECFLDRSQVHHTHTYTHTPEGTHTMGLYCKRKPGENRQPPCRTAPSCSQYEFHASCWLLKKKKGSGGRQVFSHTNTCCLLLNFSMSFSK